MTETAGLYKKLVKVMGEVHRIPKLGRNEFHKYDYVTESDLTDAIRPLLAAAGIMVMPTVEEATKEGDFARVTMRFRFIDADTGESIESVFLGEGQDKGDKAFYKAYTGAVKYVLMKTFLVATGDDPEADEQPNDKSLKAPEKVIESPPSNEPAMDRTKAALLKTINTVTTKKGLADRKEIHRLAGEVCGREIKSLNDCTPDELKKLLTFFNKGVA